MASAHLLQQASQHLRSGNVASADQLLSPLLAGPPQHDVLHMLGVVRFHQSRNEEAVTLITKALALENKPQAQFSLGRALASQGRQAEAAAAYRAFVALSPNPAQAQFELGHLLHRTGQPEAAMETFRDLLRQSPGHLPAILELARLLTAANRLNEAESLLTEALKTPMPPRFAAAMHAALGLALRLANKTGAALAHFEKVETLDPAMPDLDLHRAEILQDLKRYEESLAVYRKILDRQPDNAPVHNDYNDLLYRLGRRDEYLKSYDRAPPIPALQLAKAKFLMHEKRSNEAYDVYAGILARDPDSAAARAGLAAALTGMGRHGDAVLAYEKLIPHADPYLLSSAAAAFACHGDPKKAVQLCERGLAAAPDNQACLAVMGTALRVMGDERDEVLNGYDMLIRAFDLEPPEGFADMAGFNEELCAYLDGVHPATGEHVGQTLRGGSQTAYHIFKGGHDLVNRLQHRITEAVNRYAAELKRDESHPFLSRRRDGFAYAGSWSSRLRDCGFHVNHIHTEGWISSCYYAGVPDAVKDETAKQGWIKFGEPALDVALPMRRAIQPAPGRLVLFPSYMWHGTVPFRSASPRLTIAFDAVPGLMAFFSRLTYTLFLSVKALVTPIVFGANAAVVDDAGRILMVRHSYRRGWHLPGGGVERGEAPEAAVRRELGEEVGLSGGQFTLIGVYAKNVWWVGNVVALYRVTGASINFKPSLEIREILWVAPDAPPPSGISGGMLRRLAEIRDGAASPFW